MEHEKPAPTLAGSDLREQSRIYSHIKAVLMFHDGGNRRVPNEADHMRVIQFVLDHRDKEDSVRSILNRGITTYAEIMEALEVSDDHHATVRSGIL